MRRGACILSCVLAFLGAAACRTVADPPPPPPVPVVSTPTPLPEATPAPPPAVFAVPAASPAATPEAPVSFEASVKPLLARTCTPCHVPGGRMYERGVDGSECEWGKVLAYEPPHRIVYSWQLQGDFHYDPDPAKGRQASESDAATRATVRRMRFSPAPSTW